MFPFRRQRRAVIPAPGAAAASALLTFSLSRAQVRWPCALGAGLALAEDIEADLDIPPFDKSVMDGFAIRAADSKIPGSRLEIVGDSFAGEVPLKRINRGEAFQVMTGAAIPGGST